MNYYINRGGQQFGPYSLADLQKYFAEGSITSTDQARSEGMQNWVPVTQVLATAAAPGGAPSPEAAAPQAPAYTQPGAWQPGGVTAAPLPPSLHWALVLVLSIVTCGIFALVWMFIQAGWVKKIDAANRTTFWLVLGLCLYVFGIIIMVAGIAAGSSSRDPSAAMGAALGAYLFMIPGGLLLSGGLLELRSSLEIYYNSVEPIKLRLSGPLTMLFGIIYFQYHLGRIHRWKTTGYLEPQNIKS